MLTLFSWKRAGLGLALLDLVLPRVKLALATLSLRIPLQDWVLPRPNLRPRGFNLALAMPRLVLPRLNLRSQIEFSVAKS